VGVDLFFALSGFLITGILYDTHNSSRRFWNFYARRLLRVFPLYYAFILVVILVSFAQHQHWYWRTFLYLTYTSNLDPTYGLYTSTPWVSFGHFWSLAVEEQFYLIWPSVVYLLRTKRRIFTVALLLAACSFGTRCYVQLSGLEERFPYMAYSWTPSRLDTILLGSALAIAVRSRKRDLVLRLAPGSAALGCMLILIYAFFAGGFTFGHHTVVTTVGILVVAITSCALIASVLRSDRMLTTAFEFPVLRFLGRYSYGLYVYHYTILGLGTVYLTPVFLRVLHSHLFSALATSAIVALISIAVAWLSFRYFENPILGLKRHFQDDSPTPKLRRQLMR
jgi:peptidoglycan/LPS O-acetylase OafA/YrhL